MQRKLRRLQRLSVFNKNRDDSLRLDSMLSSDKASFWRKINKFKKLKKKNAVFSSEKPNLLEFSDFYENLFSHVDRPSNEVHKSI